MTDNIYIKGLLDKGTEVFLSQELFIGEYMASWGLKSATLSSHMKVN